MKKLEIGIIKFPIINKMKSSFENFLLYSQTLEEHHNEIKSFKRNFILKIYEGKIIDSQKYYKTFGNI